MSSDAEKSATDAQSEEKSTPAEKPAPKPVAKKPEEPSVELPAFEKNISAKIQYFNFTFLQTCFKRIFFM